MKTIAIMQPYFIPYAGYFRLLAKADMFVVLDTVQFPRRGWVHRNKLLDHQLSPRWLTLPVQKCARDTAIKDLKFAQDGQSAFQSGLSYFPNLETNEFLLNAQPNFADKLKSLHGSPVQYLCRLLIDICSILDIPCQMMLASELDIPNAQSGQDRILAILKELSATKYINAPGGKDLYDKVYFDQQNIELEFLSDYSGSNLSILHRLCTEKSSTIKQEIIMSC